MCPSLEILHLFFFFFFFFNFLLQYPTNNIVNSKQKLRNSLCTNNKLLSFSLSSLSLSLSELFLFNFQYHILPTNIYIYMSRFYLYFLDLSERWWRGEMELDHRYPIFVVSYFLEWGKPAQDGSGQVRTMWCEGILPSLLLQGH